MHTAILKGRKEKMGSPVADILPKSITLITNPRKKFKPLRLTDCGL